ncbi:MAG: hypothetical protein Q9226_006756 [Calogaya cf. arnoldii]
MFLFQVIQWHPVAGPVTKTLQVPGGPRPTNTLSNPRQTASRVASAPRHVGRQLETTTTVGNNVKCSTLEYEWESGHLREPRPKRRKLGPEPEINSQNTPQIVDESDEADQIMKEDDVVQVKHVTRPLGEDFREIGKPIVNGGSSKPTRPYAQNGQSQREFQAVETLMDSSQQKSRKHRSRHKNGAYDVLAMEGSSFASSKSESFEILDSEPTAEASAKGAYKGTANLYPSRRSQMTSEANTGRSTTERSSYFPAPTSDKASIKHEDQLRSGKAHSPASEARLRDQYRDSDNKRRGSAESPDELVIAEPNSRTLSPIKSARLQSPSKISQPESARRHSIEDELGNSNPTPSDIKPSGFTRVAKKGPRSNVTIYHGEKQAPWGMPLRSYNFRGQTCMDDGLALVYNDNEKSYEIHCSGMNLAKIHPDLRIRPKKLQRILWAQEGTKMRFQSSKVVDMDEVLDLEVCNQKDVQTLNACLQENGSIFSKGIDREKLHQMFDHRIKEHQKAIGPRQRHNSRQPEDLQLADRNLERADKKRALDEQHRPNSKRHRIVDALSSDGKSHQKERIQQDRLRDKTVLQNHAITTAREMTTAFDLDDLNPLDDNLKRNLRSRNATGSLSRPLQELSAFSFNEEAQHEEVEKYSKVHGFGKPWPKPLVYPKEGKKRTTVNFDDLDRLDEGEFLNDNLIAFYLRYLEHQADKDDPTMARKVYMFNTFFYASLTTTKPGQRGINYEAVQKWTRGVDIFTYDFVVVPVNESAHWYVAIICNLPALNRKLGGFDGDSAPDSGSSKEIELDQPTENRPLISSSPRTLASNDDRQDADLAAEDPKEHETTASFAEMSLEAPVMPMVIKDMSPEIPRPSHPNDPEQDLLNCQLQQAENKDQKVGDPDAQEVRSPDRKIEEVVETNRTTSPRLRPGKRKSLASTRVFDPYRPTILTFDSFGTAHAQTVKVLKQYLREEANDKRGQMEFDEKELQGVTAKQIPQQDNFCDCGLYLLGYMEKFFQNPRDFIDKIMRRQWDLQKDWPNLGPSIMRTKLRSLLLELGKSHLQEIEKARIARRANTKSTKASPPSSKIPISRSTPSNMDGADSVETTTSKPGLEAARTLLSEDPAPPPAEKPKEPTVETSLSPKGAVSKSPRHKNEPAAQRSPSLKEAAFDSADHADEPIRLPRETFPLSRQAALESALLINEDMQQQQPGSAAESHHLRTADRKQRPAAEAQAPPPAVIEEPAAQSIIVPDSQPESLNVPGSQEPDTKPESFAFSPELQSTIQDSQPPIPELPLEDLRKDATPPPARSKRHMTSFSSPLLPPSKSVRDPNDNKKFPATPNTAKSTHALPPSEQQKSSPKNRSTRQRPILGAQPAMTGTNPKVVINIDD